MIKIHLRELMWEKDITAVTLSKATGISRATISDINRRKRVNLELDTVDKLCNFLGCKLTDLIEYTPDK